MQQLITVDEVIESIGLDAKNNRREIQRGILDTELHESETSLGYEAYQKLIDAKNNYTASAYDSATTYNSGDYVTFQNLLVYESLATQTGVPPTPENIAAGAWREALKFDTSNSCAADYETLWDRYLKRYLAMKVVQTICVTTTIRLTGTGMSRSANEYQSVATDGDMRLAEQAWGARARKVFNAMQAFAKREAKSCYQDFAFYEKSSPAQRRRLNKKVVFTKIRY